MMQLQPLQSNNDVGCVDFPYFLPTGMPVPGLPHEREYLPFFISQTMNTACGRGIHFTTIIDERSLVPPGLARKLTPVWSV